MSTTEDWLRYIESKVIQQRYNIKDYQKDDTDKPVEESTDSSSSNV